jgi:hypothetical protein
MWTRPDYDGFPTPFGMVALFDRSKECIHINMQDYHWSEIISFIGFHMLLYNKISVERAIKAEKWYNFEL